VQHANETHIVNSWLGDLAHQIDTPLMLNEYNVCAIGHVSGIDCIIEAPATHGLVLLRAALLPWPRPEAQAAERFLELHFLGLKTGGASFAIDAEERELVLWMSRRLAALDSNSFSSMVAEFLEQAAWWKNTLLADDDPNARSTGSTFPAAPGSAAQV